MSHELVKSANEKAVEIVQTETLSKWLGIFGNKLEPKEQEQFLQIAMGFNLNPFKREIYCTAYGEGQYRQLSIITGYEVYLKRAESTGLLDGYDVKTTGTIKTEDLKAICTIYRKDRKFPFVWEVSYSEYVQKKKDGTITGFWKDKPETMIKKVAISQAFRLCFPLEIGGMPYTADEMPDNIENAEVIPERKQPEVKTPPEKSVKEILKEAGISDDEYAEYNIAHKLNTADQKKVEAKIKANPAGAVNHIKEWKTRVITMAEKTINDTAGCSLVKVAEYCDTYNVPMIKFLVDLNIGKETLNPVLSWIDADTKIENDLPF